jgi:hypothetical protein
LYNSRSTGSGGVQAKNAMSNAALRADRLIKSAPSKLGEP